MAEQQQHAIKVHNSARRCPYCHGNVEMEEAKAVCNDCLAVCHLECWEEANRCSSCNGTNRLVKDAQAKPAATERRGRTPILAPLDLAPETHVRPVQKSDPGFYEVREHQRFGFLESEAGQDKLRRSLKKQAFARVMDPKSTAALSFMLAYLLVILSFPAMGILEFLFFLMVVSGALGYFLKTTSARIESELNAAELLPVPVKLRELDNTVNNGLYTGIFELDAQSDEEPESYYEIQRDENVRVIGVDIPIFLKHNVKPGDFAMLITHNKCAIVLERLS